MLLALACTLSTHRGVLGSRASRAAFFSAVFPKTQVSLHFISNFSERRDVGLEKNGPERDRREERGFS